MGKHKKSIIFIIEQQKNYSTKYKTDKVKHLKEYNKP